MAYLLEYWYFHIPNYVIAALIYTMLGRFLLGLFVPYEWDNFIWRFFCRITDPVLAVTRWLTFGALPYGILPLIAVVWLFLLRIAYWMLLYRLGLAPTVALG